MAQTLEAKNLAWKENVEKQKNKMAKFEQLINLIYFSINYSFFFSSEKFAQNSRIYSDERTKEQIARMSMILST